MTSDTTAPPAAPTPRLPLAALSMAVPVTIFAVTAISVALAAAQAFTLSAAQTTALIIALYGIPGATSLVLSGLFRQPLLLAWHTGVMIFIASLADELSYAEVSGAVLVAGALVVLIGAFGLSSYLATIIPAPIVFGVLAGSVLPYVVRIFTDLADHPITIGAALAAYLLGRRLNSARLPPTLLAVIAGLLAAALLGDLHALPAGWSWPTPTPTRPTFSPGAVVAVVPVAVLLIAVQSNLATVVFLRSEGFRPPERLLQVACGATTMLGSLLGAAPISTGSLVMPLLAGPQAGEQGRRYWSVYAVGLAFVALAAAASVAAQLPAVVPLALLFALAGLALVGVLVQALTEMMRGPLRLGPLFAFAVASSKLTLLGLGPLFWALVIGLAVTVLVEGAELRALRTP